VGSLFAMLVAAFIVIATAATLYPKHVEVQTAEQAAQALAPIAGSAAKYLFAVGLFGASMLAAAVLPLATAYSVTEALGVEKGISAGFREAPIFMGIFTGLMAIGALVSLIPGLPVIQALVLLQAIDCLLLPFVLFSILRLVNSRKLMGDLVNGPVYNAVARTATLVVTVLSLALLVMTVLSWFGTSS
jgi:Mn2+/Fe2+ NRAMP family transporter